MEENEYKESAKKLFIIEAQAKIAQLKVEIYKLELQLNAKNAEMHGLEEMIIEYDHVFNKE